MYRYAIPSAEGDWSGAEAQVARLSEGAKGKSTVISVKSSAAAADKKRKAGEESVNGQASGDNKKKTRRSNSVKKTRR